MATSPNLEDKERFKFRDTVSDNTVIAVTGDSDAPVPAIPALVSPTIFNVTTGASFVEVSQALGSNVRRFTIKNRDNGILQLAFVATESGTLFKTIPVNAEYSEDNLNSTLTLFFQSNKAAQNVEIVRWA